MCLAPVVIGADYAALEDGEEVFSGVAVLLALAELAAGVERVLVIRELAANGAVDVGSSVMSVEARCTFVTIAERTVFA